MIEQGGPVVSKPYAILVVPPYVLLILQLHTCDYSEAFTVVFTT